MLSSDLVRFLKCNYRILEENGQMILGDGQVENALAAHGIPAAEALLSMFKLPISRAVGCSLVPTYSYSRIYFEGAVLRSHLDRPSCEISATLTIDCDSKHQWPIFLCDRLAKVRKITLRPGDALVYAGAELKHWREHYIGHRQVQVFLHYVKEGGAHESQIFDGRLRLGAPKPKSKAVSPRG